MDESTEPASVDQDSGEYTEEVYITFHYDDDRGRLMLTSCHPWSQRGE